MPRPCQSRADPGLHQGSALDLDRNESIYKHAYLLTAELVVRLFKSHFAGCNVMSSNTKLPSIDYHPRIHSGIHGNVVQLLYIRWESAINIKTFELMIC